MSRYSGSEGGIHRKEVSAFIKGIQEAFSVSPPHDNKRSQEPTTQRRVILRDSMEALQSGTPSFRNYDKSVVSKPPVNGILLPQLKLMRHMTLIKEIKGCTSYNVSIKTKRTNNS